MFKLIFILSILLIIVGSFMCFKGDGSLFSAPSGGGSRIPPDSQVRLNESVQKITGHKDDYSESFHKSNVFTYNKLGIIFLISGLALLVILMIIS